MDGQSWIEEGTVAGLEAAAVRQAALEPADLLGEYEPPPLARFVRARLA